MAIIKQSPRWYRKIFRSLLALSLVFWLNSMELSASAKNVSAKLKKGADGSLYDGEGNEYAPPLLPDPVSNTKSILKDLATQLESLTQQKPSCIDSKKVLPVYPVVTLPGTKSGDLPVSVLRPDELQKIFKEIAGNPNIPFNFPDFGCEDRAHKVAQLLEQKGIRSVKTFVEGDLEFDTPNSPTGFVRWPVHVTAAVAVQQPNGKIGLMVIDPTTFDHPVSVKDWVAKITTKSKKKPVVYFTERFNRMPLLGNGKSMNLRTGNWRVSDFSTVDIIFSQIRQKQIDRDNGMEQPPDQDYPAGMGVGLPTGSGE